MAGKCSSDQMNSNFVQRGGWWVVGQFLLLVAAAILGVACRDESPHPLLLLCGWLLLGASALCGVGGGVALGRNLTPFPKPLVRSQLVQRGIYGWMRHPIYTAVICAFVGWSLIQSSWPAFAVSVVIAVFLDAKARHEEHWLRQQFPDYGRYEQQVRRFIPWLY